MIVFLYIIFIVVAGLLTSILLPGFTDDINMSFYLVITVVFTFSALIILLRRRVSFFRTLSIYIAIFLTLFIIAEGALIYFSADTSTTGEEQAIIVAGSGLFVESRLTVELEKRIDKAIEIHAANPSLPIILSGGTDENRALPECVAMKSYLDKQIKKLGLDMPTVIMEDNSTGIVENITLSLEKADVDSAYIIVSRHNLPQTKLVINKLSPNSSVVGTGYPLSKYIIYYIRELWFAGKTAVEIGF